MEEVIKFLKDKGPKYDAIGNAIKQEPDERAVYAEISSIGSNEFFKAAVQSLKASLVFKVFFADYNKEQRVLYCNKEYNIYRTYLNEKSDKIELYCSEV